MTATNSETIEKLINELKVNDMEKEKLYGLERFPEEPREAIEALIRIGKPAVDHLIELLKNPQVLSCAYAIKILGEIGDERAIKPMLEVLTHKDLLEISINDKWGDIGDLVVEALKKIGAPALEHIIGYIDENWENPYALLSIPGLLSEIKDERSFNALIKLLSHPDTDIREFVATGLGNYGDPRAVEHLERLLDDEESRVISATLESIRKLTDLKRYRSILKTHKELSLKRIESCKNTVNENFLRLESLYAEYRKLEGDNAQEINAIVDEYQARESIHNMLMKLVDLGADEGVIPSDMHEKLTDLIFQLHSENRRIDEEYGEEIRYVVRRHYPASVRLKTGRSYRGLARNINLVKRDREKYPERTLGKYLIMRDWVHMARYILEGNGGQVTPEVVELCERAVKMYQNNFLGSGDHLEEDGLPYYTEALAILGRGFEVAWTLKADRQIDSNPPVIVARFASSEDLIKYLRSRIKVQTKDLEGKYV